MATALTSNYNLSANANNNNSSTSNISYTSTSTNGYHDNNHVNNTTSNNYHNNNNSQSLSTCSSALSSTMSTTAVAASSAYRVGEYVYVEISPSSPYLVCKIEELIKTQNGNYEVKLIVFYRRRDMSLALIQQSICALQEEQEKEYEQFSEKEKHQIKLRELFLSRQIETYPTSSIKGKCQVALLCEWESLRYYLKREDTFFYTQVYDPEQKNITEAERGEIRVGLRYQAEVPAQPLEDPIKEDTRRSEDLETLVFTPDHNLTESEMDKYLVVAKSIGTYARALDCSSNVKQPSLLASASLASRDITIQHAMDVLHECNYDLAKAVCRLVPKSGPVLCRDEMEEWSATEIAYFDEAIDKCEKKFEEIRQNYLPWKCMKNLIEYYYFWKTTDRYIQRKRVKVVENENKLKQVFISNHNILSPTIGGDELNGSKCASCKKTSSSNWHVWGVTNMQFFLCQSCWSFWRKFGAFKYPNRFADMNAEKLQLTTANYSNQINNANVRTAPVNDLNPPLQQSFACRDCNRTFHRQDRLLQHMASHRPFKCTSCCKEFKFKNQLQKHCSNSHGMAMRSGSPRPIMKTRAAFYFNAVPALKFARNICTDILNLKRAARRPHAINIALFKQEYSERLEKGDTRVPKLKKIDRGKVVDISHRLGTPKMPKPEWLIATPKNKLPHPERLAFPPNKNEEFAPDDVTDHNSKDFSETSRKRPLEHNGNFIPSKRRQMAPPSILGKSVPDLYENISRNSVSTQSLNGRAKIATITNLSGKKQMISWVDAPDDVFFVCTKKIKQLRRRIPLPELLRAARQPYKLHYDYLLMQANSSSSSSSSSQALPNVAANRSSAQTSTPIPVNKMNPVHNQTATAAAALNLAGITSSLSAQPQLPQQVAALFQQQMLNLPLLGSNANHLVSPNAFFSGLSPPTNNSTGSTGNSKSNR